MKGSHCSICGTPLTAGRCLACDTRRWSRLVHRELVLLIVLVGVTIAAFFGTRAIARNTEALRRQQAAAWFDAGQQASHDGRTETALAGLRRAVSKDPGNRQYRLALADALASAGRADEAKRVLLALRELQPEDPDANLQLARLEARGADADAARRYYQNALAALWRPEQTEPRRHVRAELIEFLLARRERARALSELLVLASNLPQDAGAQVQVAEMFRAAGEPRMALEHYASALRQNPKTPEALAGAGEAAFELADYSRALRYLQAVTHEDARIAVLRDVARLVLERDPLAPRLGANERRRRVRLAVDQAMQRLDACRADPSVGANAGLEPLGEEAQAFQASLRLPRRQEPPDLVDDGIDLAYRIERAVEQRCGAPSAPFDQALLLIGRRHGFGEP